MKMTLRNNKYNREIYLEDGFILDSDGERMINIYDPQEVESFVTIDKYLNIFVRALHEHLTKFKHNQTVLADLLLKQPTLQEQFPNLCKIMGNLVGYLIDLNRFNEQNVLGGFAKYNGDFYCFASARSLAKKYRRGKHNTWNRNINLLCALGLIHKVPIDKLTDKVRRRANRVAKQVADRLGIDRDDIKPTNFYSVPYYNDGQLQLAEERASLLREHGFRIRSFSKTTLELALGNGVANEVFPDDDRVISQYTRNLIESIESVILKEIERKGYTTKKEVIAKMRVRTPMQIRKKYQSWTNRVTATFDASIVEIMEKYGLERRKASKDMIAKYGLKSSIYIIHPVTSL